MWQSCIATLCVGTYIHTYVYKKLTCLVYKHTYIHMYVRMFVYTHTCTYIHDEERKDDVASGCNGMPQTADDWCGLWCDARTYVPLCEFFVVHVRTSLPTDLSIDAMDVSGEQQFDVMHNIVKQRLSPDGSVVQEKELESEQFRCVCSCASIRLMPTYTACSTTLGSAYPSVYCVCVCEGVCVGVCVCV